MKVSGKYRRKRANVMKRRQFFLKLKLNTIATNKYLQSDERRNKIKTDFKQRGEE